MLIRNIETLNSLRSIHEHVTCKQEKPTTQSSTFHFVRSSQNKKSLPFSYTYSEYKIEIKQKTHKLSVDLSVYAKSSVNKYGYNKFLLR